MPDVVCALIDSPTRCGGVSICGCGGTSDSRVRRRTIARDVLPCLRVGLSSSLQKRLDVYLPRRHVYRGDTPNLPWVDPVILLSRGGEAHVRNQVQHRFIRSHRCNALNAHGDAMTVFGFNCGSAVEVGASIGTQLEVLDATTYFASDAAFDISLESHINSCSLQGHLFLAA